MSRFKARVERKTNPQLVALIKDLCSASHEKSAPIWRDIAERLSGPTSKRPAVNLSRIERYAKKDEIILVPGKLLGTGVITKPVTVAAYAFSQSAVKKLHAAGGKAISIRELLSQRPDGSGIRIME
ncbi:MAG: 50S ribosomal protein L18e [Thermoplasmata archaeon]